MSVQFKFREDVGEDRRREIIDALGRAGFAARSLFPKQKRAALASIFTLRDAEAQDLTALRNTLRGYGAEIEYVEAAPERSLKTLRWAVVLRGVCSPSPWPSTPICLRSDYDRGDQNPHERQRVSGLGAGASGTI